MPIRYLKISFVVFIALLCLFYAGQNIANLDACYQAFAYVLSRADHTVYANSIFPALQSGALTWLVLALVVSLEFLAGLLAVDFVARQGNHGVGALFETGVDFVCSAHGNIDKGLRHHRVRPIDSRQLSCHGAQGDGRLLDRLHGPVVRARVVGARIDGDHGALGSIAVGRLIDSVSEERRRPDRHTTDLDIRVSREVDARIDRPGSLQVTEAHHIGLPRQDVDLDLAGHHQKKTTALLAVGKHELVALIIPLDGNGLDAVEFLVGVGSEFDAMIATMFRMMVSAMQTMANAMRFTTTRVPMTPSRLRIINIEPAM